MATQTYDFALASPVGSHRLIQTMGSRVKLQSCLNGPVRVRTDGGSSYDLLPGQGFRLPDGQVFREIYVSNLSGLATLGTLIVGDQDFIDDRVSGSVEVIDGERSKVQSGVVFSGVCEIAGTTAGPRIQVYNAAGSGRNVVVTSVMLGSATADSWALRVSPTQLANLAPEQPNNHDSTGAAPTATTLRYDTTGPVITLKGYRVGFLQAGADRQLTLPRPLLLRPGYGALVIANLTATSLRAAFEFEEYPA